MILTNEEIQDVLTCDCATEFYLASDYIEAGAKAQLKKVVEWLETRWNGTEFELYNIVAIPKEDWQALLEEAE